MTFDECVITAYKWLLEAPTADRKMFQNTSRDELYVYHHTLGRHIRNECGLWEAPWVPWKENVVDGIDCSPDHPDAVSMRIIQAVWDKMNANESSKELLLACQAAYKKHIMNDDTLGWDELGVVLQTALCNTMGDATFTAWLEKQKSKGNK